MRLPRLHFGRRISPVLQENLFSPRHGRVARRKKIFVAGLPDQTAGHQPARTSTVAPRRLDRAFIVNVSIGDLCANMKRFRSCPCGGVNFPNLRPSGLSAIPCGGRYASAQARDFRSMKYELPSTKCSAGTGETTLCLFSIFITVF